MEQLMDKLRRVDGLIENQSLSYDEKQNLKRNYIESYVKEKQQIAYKKGLMRSRNAISDLMSEI
jgi:membrane-bound lytic murein transglycosylase MltF